MWSILSRKSQLLVIVFTTIVVLQTAEAIIQLTTAGELSFLDSVSLVAFVIGTILVVVVSMFWRSLWKMFPILAQHLFPDLNGKWQGTLVTTWKNPKTKRSPGPIDVTVWIRQTPFTLSIRQQTQESASSSIHVFAEVRPDADIYRVWYSYDNTPKAKHSHRSTQHEGVAWLEVNLSEDPNRLSGQYYTERKTNGDIDLRRVENGEKEAFNDQSTAI